MAILEKKPGETIDSLLRKFNKKMKMEGVLQEVRKREFYEKPSDEKKKRKRAAERRTYLQHKANEL